MMLKYLFSYKGKYQMLLFLQKFKSLKYFKNVVLDPNKKYAFVFLAADLGNLGDVAITYAQNKFIQEHSDYEVVEIPISQNLEGLALIKRKIKKNDIVTIVGGGNLGDLYKQNEFLRQLVVKSFPDNKIISFPQTFDFKERKALETAKKVYGKHKNLYLVAREKDSYQMMRQHFKKNNVLLTPDIVLTLTEHKGVQRRGALLCLRNDKEKMITPTEMGVVISTLENRFGNVKVYDTHLNRNRLSPEERIAELNKIWQAFSASELVVTDRLHGMVFCYITKTPCIVFPNNNHKIKGTYEWIKETDSLHFTENCNEETVNKIYTISETCKKETSSIKEKFQPLIELFD